MMIHRRVSFLASLVSLMHLAPTTSLGAQEPNTAPEPAPPPAEEPIELRIPGSDEIDDPLLRALLGGKFDLNVRFRYEFAEIDGFDESNAGTIRTRLGYTTQRFEGFQGAVQFENNTALDDESYNAAGLNGQPGRSVIADPEDTELNQLWLDYDFRAHADLPVNLRVGRQRIILDDARFVGNVGWRQLEQTFDAVRLNAELHAHLALDYSYVWEVNRIFGPDANRDYDSDSHLIHLAWDGLSLGKLTGFAYLLDLEGGAAPVGQTVSSQTYGLRLTGEQPLDNGLSFGYLASAAWQTDYAENPTNYDAPYLALEGKLADPGGLFGGLGFELLGSDDGNAAFATPLATLHKFNGYADAFLATPAVGLRDYYGFLGTQLPKPLDGKATLIAHRFTGDDNTDPLGWELDAVASHRFNHHLTGLLKWAYFDGDNGLSDIHRFWAQIELTF